MIKWIKGVILWAWKIVATPAGTLGLGFLTLGGFVGGVMFWGAFNTALELTNTEKFCTSCHEMRDNVYQELTRTIHFSNRSGVRASCMAKQVSSATDVAVSTRIVSIPSAEAWISTNMSTPVPAAIRAEPA